VANARRYLLPSERPVIEVRRHWAFVAADTLKSLGLLIFGLFVLRVVQDTGMLETLAVYFTVFVVLRWVFIILDWWVEKFIVTDKRVLLVTGIAYRKVAIMPLIKVTDLTYNRSATGMMFGYGEFVVESAGQDQALSKINFIPQPEKLYIQMSELLFGGDKGVPALPSPAEREAELRLGERALSRRRRRFRGWRRRPGAGRGAPVAEERFSDLDDLLARRDTLLAEREANWAAGPRRTADGGWEDLPADESTQELPRIHDPLRDSSRNQQPGREPPAGEPRGDERPGGEPRDREPRDREPRDREPRDREPRDREPRDREPRDREPRERQPPYRRGPRRPQWPGDGPPHAPPVDPADD
jgi:hypothetical protein